MSPNSVEIIPAVMPKSREELFHLAEVIRPFAKTAQLDVVDGLFDNDLTWPYTAIGVLEDFEAGFQLPFPDKIFWEMDLMTRDPRHLGTMGIAAGARRIIAHAEVFENDEVARETFDVWHRAGAQAGVSILLDTPIAKIEGIFYDVEVVQIMGIAEIGAQGHPFDERVLVRVRELRNRFPQAVIAVDGGVNVKNARALTLAGANRLCVGSAILKATDPKAAYEEIVAVTHI